MTALPHAINDPTHWDSLAKRYADEADRMTGIYCEAAWQLAALPPGARVLDVATGAGALLSIALKDGADAIGIDFSPGMVSVAKERAAAIRPGERALVMDGQALDFTAASFDAAFSMFGVFMFPDPIAGFAEIARVLRPGGRLALVWNRRDERVGWVAALSEAMESGENEMIRMEEVAIGPPFGPLETLEREWGFELDLERLLELVRSRSYVITAPPGKRAEILDRVRDLVATDPALAGRERFELPYRTFAFRAHLPG